MVFFSLQYPWLVSCLVIDLLFKSFYFLSVLSSNRKVGGVGVNLILYKLLRLLLWHVIVAKATSKDINDLCDTWWFFSLSPF